MEKRLLHQTNNRTWRAVEGNHLLDTALITLIYLSRHSLLPEIYEVLGPDKFIEFIEIFGGKMLAIPTKEHLQAAILDAHIFSELRNNPSDESKVRALATKHMTSGFVIKKIYDKVKKEFESIESSGLASKMLRAECSDEEDDALDILENHIDE